MSRRMGMKRTVFITLTIMTFFTAVYFTLFNHPPAEEILTANRGQSKRRPEWMEKTSIQEVNPIAKKAEAESGKVFVREANNTIENIVLKSNELERNKNNQQISRNVNDKIDEKVDKNGKADVKETKEEAKSGIGRHGLKLFDWDKWIAENGFVSVGKIWAFCDEPDPPVVGAALLMADELGGIKIVTVMNTTFVNSILFGTIAVKVEYGGVRLYTNEFPVCDMAEEDAFFTCPMKAGDQYYMREDHVPGLLPAGNYYTEAKLIDHHQKTVVCANCDLNIK